MSENILDLVPVEFICPICGQWHKIKNGNGYTFKDINKIKNLSCEAYHFDNFITFLALSDKTFGISVNIGETTRPSFRGTYYYFNINEWMCTTK